MLLHPKNPLCSIYHLIFGVKSLYSECALINCLHVERKHRNPKILVVDLTHGSSIRNVSSAVVVHVLSWRTIRFNLVWDRSHLFLAVWMGRVLNWIRFFHLSNHEKKICAAFTVFCCVWLVFRLFWGRERGGMRMWKKRKIQQSYERFAFYRFYFLGF